jgi:NAD(P)-dependent dehydrogenase (short-subunit alcohol dehydrogenase family)
MIIKKNSVYFLAGGAGKIGGKILKEIIKYDCAVIVVDNNLKSIEVLKKEFNPHKKKILFIKKSLNTKNNINSAINTSLKKFKKIHGVINCMYPISLGWGKRFEDVKEKELKEALFYQAGLPFILSQSFMKYFLKVKGGVLVNISSIQGIRSPKFEHYKNLKMTSPAEYSIAKSGIIALTKYLAKYYSKKNIRVNCVSPGGIKDNQNETFLKRYKSSCNSKGMLDAEDIVGTIMFLISENSKYINGQNIVVDDGWSL